MKLLDKLKELNRVNLGEVMLPGYVFNKNLFRVAIALVAVVLVAVALQIGLDWNGSENIYFSCPSPSHDDSFPGGFRNQPCANPLFNPMLCHDASIECQEVFLPGESYGKEPAPLTRFYGWVVFLIMLLAVLCNHLGFNRGYFKAHKEELLERFNNDKD